MAVIYYDKNHFVEAARRFGDIINRYPEEGRSADAADLSMGVLEEKEEWLELNKLARIFKAHGGKTVKVLSARLSEQKGSTPGAVIESKGKLVVACGDGGGLELLTVQPQGKKAMDAKAFLAGHPVAVGTVLGA